MFEVAELAEGRFIWALPIGMAIATANLLGSAFPHGRAGVHAALALLVGLSAGVTIIVWGDSAKGERGVGRQIAAGIPRYVHIILSTPFLCGR